MSDSFWRWLKACPLFRRQRYEITMDFTWANGFMPTNEKSEWLTWSTDDVPTAFIDCSFEGGND